jgi:putative oxidoreductase
MESNKKMKVLNIVLWMVQVILAGMFLMAGFMKTTMPLDQLAVSLPWVSALPHLVRFIGISEFLGALGLLLPSLLRIKPVLTPVAALGIIAVMLMATVFHITRGEYSAVVFTMTLALGALFIAWGRFSKVPVRSKK